MKTIKIIKIMKNTANLSNQHNNRVLTLGCENTRNMMEIQNTYEFYFKDTIEK